MSDRMKTPPLLVVHDKDDRETAWQDGADIASRWPHAELHTTTGLGHVRILRDSAVVERTSDATILLRSVSDAEELAAEFGDRLQVVAGALDGLRSEPFEVVLAADGLDRVLGYDSESLSWSERRHRMRSSFWGWRTSSPC